MRKFWSSLFFTVCLSCIGFTVFIPSAFEPNPDQTQLFGLFPRPPHPQRPGRRMGKGTGKEDQRAGQGGCFSGRHPDAGRQVLSTAWRRASPIWECRFSPIPGESSL